MRRDFQRTLFPRIARGRIERAIYCVALGGTCHINKPLRDGKFTLRASQLFIGIPGAQGELQGARIGIADVFAGYAHGASCDIQRVAATIEHAREPIECRIRI